MVTLKLDMFGVWAPGCLQAGSSSHPREPILLGCGCRIDAAWAGQCGYFPVAVEVGGDVAFVGARRLIYWKRVFHGLGMSGVRSE